MSAYRNGGVLIRSPVVGYAVIDTLLAHGLIGSQAAIVLKVVSKPFRGTGTGNNNNLSSHK